MVCAVTKKFTKHRYMENQLGSFPIFDHGVDMRILGLDWPFFEAGEINTVSKNDQKDIGDIRWGNGRVVDEV